MTQLDCPWIYTPRTLKLAHHRDTAMFTAAPFMMAKIWNQPRSRNEWIKKIQNVCTIVLCSVIKNKIISHGGKWMEMKIMSSETRQGVKFKPFLSYVEARFLKTQI